MQPRYSPLCQLFVVLFPLLPCTAAAAEAPVVTFEDSTVVVAAGQPAGRFALLGVGRLAGGYLPAQVRLGDLVVADALGDARYESAYGVPQPSVWAAVDLATGEVTLAAPGQDGVRLREVPPRALRQELDGLDDRRRFLEVLVGRLWQVVEPSGTGGANVTTTYGHDVGNRLKSVSIAGGTTQTRTFNYDLRGLLTWERHPEKGVSGNGYVRYLDYDALGNPRRKLDAVGTASATTGAVADLRFTYDRAGRLTHVRDGLQASRLLKQLTYGTGNSGSDRRLGRLWVADRYNYVTVGGGPFTVQVKETYAYAGVGGRTSARTTQMYVNGGAQETFVQGWAWNDLGAPTTLTYPRCAQAGCTGGAATSRTVTHGYTNGFLTSIPGFATGISYHPNGMVNQVTYQVSAGSPALTWTQGLDPNGMRRPASYTVASGATPLWTSGAYAYDGAGNVGSIGTASFVYDGVSRLASGTVYTGATGGGTAKTQTAVFDPYGNITSKTTGGVLVNTPSSASTNRMTSVGSAYDSAGSMTAWNGNAYTYDPLGMAWQVTASGATYVHLYTADDERIWTYQQSAPSRWTLRDLDGKVLREFKNNAGTWTVERDYVHRDGMPLAAVTPTATTYLHPDHLGTPRLITSNTGAVLAYHVYYPFGEEATAFNQDTERMKFTGHERDLGNLTSVADDVDYMHARFYNPQTGRFLSVDPVTGRSEQPQSWNRYSYAMDNPVKYVDPDGRSIWGTIVKVVRVTGSVLNQRRVVVATVKGKSKPKTVEGVKRGLDSISPSQRSQGARRVVETETVEARDAVAKQLSDNKGLRGPQTSGDFPEHVHPDTGPYSDVHVQVSKVGVAALIATEVTRAVAPNTSALVEYGDASPGELLSAGAWDTVSALEPTGVSELINWMFLSD